MASIAHCTQPESGFRQNVLQIKRELLKKDSGIKVSRKNSYRLKCLGKTLTTGQAAVQVPHV